MLRRQWMVLGFGEGGIIFSCLDSDWLPSKWICLDTQVCLDPTEHKSTSWRGHIIVILESSIGFRLSVCLLLIDPSPSVSSIVFFPRDPLLRPDTAECFCWWCCVFRHWHCLNISTCCKSCSRARIVSFASLLIIIRAFRMRRLLIPPFVKGTRKQKKGGCHFCLLTSRYVVYR